MLELDGFVKTTLNEKATTDTEMILDREPTIEPAVIKTLIAKGVTDATKELKQTIARLQQSIDRSATKNPRGAQRASSTKKTTAPSTKKKATKKPSDQAAAPDSDTSPGKGSKKKPREKSKQNPRNKPSNKNSASRKKK